jgi:hypothetical protein
MAAKAKTLSNVSRPSQAFRRGRIQAANNRIGRADPDVRMGQQKIDDRLDARLNAFRALRRMRGDVIKYRGKVG